MSDITPTDSGQVRPILHGASIDKTLLERGIWHGKASNQQFAIFLHSGNKALFLSS